MNTLSGNFQNFQHKNYRKPQQKPQKTKQPQEQQLVWSLLSFDQKPLDQPCTQWLLPLRRSGCR